MTTTTLTDRLTTATDAAIMAERFSREPSLPASAAWDRLDVPRVLPFKGGFAVQYRVPKSDGSDHLFWGELDVSGSRSLRKAVAGPRYEELGLHVAPFPADPELPGLPRLISSDFGEALGRAMGWPDPGAPTPRAVCTVLAYRLRRRCVVRWEVPGKGDAVAVKMVRRRQLGNLVEDHSKAAVLAEEGGDLTVPRILNVDDDLGACIMSWMPGDTLHDLAGDPRLPAGYALAGKGLRALHRGAVDGGKRRGCERELGDLSGWGDVLERIGSRHADLFRRRLATLTGRAAEASSDVVSLLHGDFYDKQVLVDGDAASLIDLDGMAAGDPARDLGNALAHLELRRLQGRLSAGDPASLEASLLEGYGDPPPPRRLAWWRTASALRLAALYELRPRWRGLVPSLFEEVDACLDARRSL